jgi:hypothetical protein
VVELIPPRENTGDFDMKTLVRTTLAAMQAYLAGNAVALDDALAGLRRIGCGGLLRFIGPNLPAEINRRRARQVVRVMRATIQRRCR